MLVLDGNLYAPGSARREPAQLVLVGGGTLRLECGDRVEHFRLDSVQVSVPLGGLPRSFTFPDRAKFECEDDPAIGAWLEGEGHQGSSNLIHRLERHWKAVTVSFVVVLATVVAAFVWGIPASAHWLAGFVPREARIAVGDQTEDLILRMLGDESATPIRQQDEVRALFDEVAEATADPGVPLLLKIRAGGGLDANAIAIPNGTVIITDEMIEVAEVPEAVAGILAHEIGHLYHRHGMQMAISSASLPVLFALLTGDLASGSTLLGTIPMTLARSSYSRDHEREADEFARDTLLALRMNPAELARLFERLQEERPGDMGWLSTHPATAERIEFFRHGEE